MRSVEEPATEAVIRGPREGFTEKLENQHESASQKIKKTSQLKNGSYKGRAIIEYEYRYYLSGRGCGAISRSRGARKVKTN
ncbi:hypothetical protein GCM10020331_084010 [Ectobacillus funiculus]